VREVVPRRVDVVTLAEVLRRLVGEGIPVGDLREILEALGREVAPGAEAARDAGALAERVRVALRRHITHRLARRKRVDALVLDPLVEEAVRGAIRATQAGPVLALEPAIADDILAGLDRALGALADGAGGASGHGARTSPAPGPVIVTSAELRRHVRRLVEGDHPELPVITSQELDPEVHIEPVGRIVV
jgi:type III secretion protein V